MPRLSKIGAAALAAFGWTSGSAVSASYLVVAGGGGAAGNANGGGGGGAGGLLSGTTSLNPTLSYTITVGAGGTGTTAASPSNGSNSVFNAITSIGGGAGGYVSNGVTGGSGGGGANSSASYLGAAGTSGQGSAGGNNYSFPPYPGGGGGGAGAVGANGTGSQSGAGGVGVSNSITGSAVFYAGGGGSAGTLQGATAGAGGNGGGGAGGGASANGTSGTANLGGGGGGGGNNGAYFGGNGGSGIVIISYVGAQQFSGGVVTSSGGNTIHTFTTSGTLGPVTPLSANYLVVAGGGGTAGNRNGGGGAGGLLTGTGLIIDPYSIYVVTVGAGGAGGAGNASPTSAQDGSGSIFLAYSATGGGGNTRNGGSGGGANVTGAAGTGTSGQGFAGGLGSLSPTQGAGGGGGAGAVGSAASGSIAGAGGVGVASSISGTSTYYAGGGGGGGIGTGGAAGTGGGGAGAGGQPSTQIAGTSGTANTGGGAGGGSDYLSSPVTQANGGSGVVIISYAGSTQLMAGGVVTIAGGNVIHTFNSSGYLTPLTLLTRSLRFRSSASAYLNRTPASAGNRQIWTWSGWVKRGSVTTRTALFGFGSQGTVYINSTTPAIEIVAGGGTSIYLVTNAVYRDPAAWYHVVIAFDTTQATAANRVKLYVNGVQVTSFSSSTYPSQNYNTDWNNTTTQYLGVRGDDGVTAYWDGYMAEVINIDGQALAPTAFGTFNSYGVWQPITYGGSYGTNGFRLPFTNNASTTTLGYDFSPQGNNWTTNNISVTAGSTYDSMTDVPTLTSATAANTATFNPLAYAGTVATNGNLTATATGTAGGCYMIGTMGAYAIKTYFEVTVVSDNQTATEIGVTSATNGTASNIRNNSISYGITGSKNVLGTGSAYGASYTNGDVIGVAVDGVNGTITFYKNNTSQGVITNSFISANTTLPAYVFFSSGGSGSVNLNCGQQPFTYTPPTGYLALNTFNL